MIRAAALGLLAACASAAPAEPPRASAPGLRLTIQRAPAAVLSGESAELLVAVARDGERAYDGDVEVTLASPEPGISSAPVVVPRIAATARMTISVAPDRRHGAVALRLVAAASGLRDEVTREVLVRGAPGAVDTGFAAGGVFSLGRDDAEATGAAALAGGATLLGGRIASEAVVVRVAADGTLDPSFGVGGIARAPVAGVRVTRGLVVTPDGIDLAGAADRPFLARFDPAGVPRAVVPLAAPAGAIAPGPDATVVVGGGDGDRALRVVRLARGASDPAWGVGGVLSEPAICPAEGCDAVALAVKADGRVTACASGAGGVELRELTADGRSDPLGALRLGPEVLSRCGGVLGNSAWDFWAAGSSTRSAFTVAYFAASPTGGPLKHQPVFTVPAGPPLGPATAIGVGGPGLLVVSTTARVPGRLPELALARLGAGLGAFDPAFGGGKGWTSVAARARGATAQTLAVGSDGRVVVAGSDGDLVAARFWQ